MDLAARDAAVAQFRRQVMAAGSLIPLRHQADWMIASEGWTLLDAEPVPGDYYATVLVVADTLPPGARVVETRLINDVPCAVVRRTIVPRTGGPAHILADLAGFKGGKSWGAALWAAGFGLLPDAKVHLVASQYSVAEPEFTYLSEFLLSARGMGLTAAAYHNDARSGRMLIRLKTGAEFEVKSWERQEALKGKRITAYLFTEAYQLPGLEVYTSLSQNLRELHGFALFPTTPDRPWLSIFHDYGHGRETDWHCTCAVDARENPFTFSQRARDRDDPAKGGIMTKQKFAISWQGKLGVFAGRVYDVTRGDPSWQFTPLSHPLLWKPEHA